ncbi:MAG: hypothetical protein HZA91_20070 [Verrucomicrobia bacterium]|nr:hypothetical protein [Verrucomicrobiota bacterium]
MNESLFKEEMAAFGRKKEELMRNCAGKFAVFKGAEYLGVFETMQSAYNTAIARWGNVPFLIKRVEEVDAAEQFPSLHFGLINAHI